MRRPTPRRLTLAATLARFRFNAIANKRDERSAASQSLARARAICAVLSPARRRLALAIAPLPRVAAAADRPHQQPPVAAAAATATATATATVVAKLQKRASRATSSVSANRARVVVLTPRDAVDRRVVAISAQAANKFACLYVGMFASAASRTSGDGRRRCCSQL